MDVNALRDKAIRRNVRIGIHESVQAKISIAHAPGGAAPSKETPVLLRSMGPTCLQFMTHLRFPVNTDYTLRAVVMIGEWELGVLGHIIWRRKEDHLYVYGCELLPDRGMRRSIAQALYEHLRLAHPGARRVHEMYRSMAAAGGSSEARMDRRG
ncbi:hypothetical protein [Paenibacillus humicola]|uniref:hypothetical protein n=1 Tax=Paenibacillus humicola TaxID=3110540 RepID=UPI00237A0D6F|nr:hypothetical protein [Paenibacillus humicola]